MVNPDYFKQRNIDNTKRIRDLRLELPYFCNEYFVGIEPTTSALTRLNYAYDLRVFFYYLVNFVPDFRGKTAIDFTINDLSKVDTTHIENFIDYLSYYTFNGKNYSNENSGKARKLSTIRAMFKYFYNKNKLEKDVASKISMPKIYEKEIIRLEVDEVAKLLDLAEYGEQLTGNQKSYHEHTKIRDLALLTLFLGTGIRISELVGININDVDFNINGFTVTRKGSKRVILYFSGEVATALKAYITERCNDKKVSKEEQALFLSLQKKRISTRAVEDLVKKYSKIITPLKKISPHKLRSTYGTSLYRETGDIYVVAEVLGHKDVNTTKKHYAAISEDIRREAAKKVVLRDDKEG